MTAVHRQPNWLQEIMQINDGQGKRRGSAA